MKNFSLGIIVGLILAALYSFLGQESGKPVNSNVPLVNDRKESNVQAVATSKPINQITNTVNKTAQIQQPKAEIAISSEVQEQEVMARNESTEKDRIIGMLDSFDSNDLSRIESILTHLNDKTPSERFEAESVDVNWALQKQADLEYSFYEKSALKDVGTLESIRCKSQLCQVRVLVPADVNLKPSHYMDWSTPISTSINPSQSNPEFREIVMYLNKP